MIWDVHFLPSPLSGEGAAQNRNDTTSNKLIKIIYNTQNIRTRKQSSVSKLINSSNNQPVVSASFTSLHPGFAFMANKPHRHAPDVPPAHSREPATD